MNRQEFFAHFTHLSPDDSEELSLAYFLSKEGHRRQVRDDGRRYFEHPRELTVLLAKRGHKDKKTAITSLLHDNPEDTFTPPVIISKLFGAEVLTSVLTLSKVVRVFDHTGKVIRVIKKTSGEYWGAITAGDFTERIIKCGDRYLNFKDMKNWNRRRQLAYAAETEERVIPIAEKTDPWFEKKLKDLLVEVRAA